MVASKANTRTFVLILRSRVLENLDFSDDHYYQGRCHSVRLAELSAVELELLVNSVVDNHQLKTRTAVIVSQKFEQLAV